MTIIKPSIIDHYQSLPTPNEELPNTGHSWPLQVARGGSYFFQKNTDTPNGCEALPNHQPLNQHEPTMNGVINQWHQPMCHLPAQKTIYGNHSPTINATYQPALPPLDAPRGFSPAPGPHAQRNTRNATRRGGLWTSLAPVRAPWGRRCGSHS